MSASSPVPLDSGTLQRARRRGVEVDEQRLADILAQAHFQDPALASATADAQKVVVPGTSVFVATPGLGDVAWDVATATALFLALGSNPIGSLAVAFRRIVQRMRLLDEAERDMLVVLAQYSNHCPYDVPVPLGRIMGAFEEDAAKVPSLLASMKDRKILIETPNGWRVVR